MFEVQLLSYIMGWKNYCKSSPIRLDIYQYRQGTVLCMTYRITAGGTSRIPKLRIGMYCNEECTIF